MLLVALPPFLFRKIAAAISIAARKSEVGLARLLIRGVFIRARPTITIDCFPAGACSIPYIIKSSRARRAVYKSKRMVNSLKSFLEVEKPKDAMLPTKERMDKWASKLSPRKNIE